MNIPDQHRCAWSTAGTRSLRCMCPAATSTSQFCIFHRHKDAVDANGIVAWSQDATPEEFIRRAQALAYPNPSPTEAALRAMLAAKPGRKTGGSFAGLDEWIAICRERSGDREPGQDEQEAAAAA